MNQEQSDLELTYSKKLVNLAWRNTNVDPILKQEMIDRLDTYRTGSYYQSKNDRLDSINSVDSSDIIDEIIIATVAIRDMSVIQQVITKLAHKLFSSLDQIQAVTTVIEILTVLCEFDLYHIYFKEDVNNSLGTLAIKSNIPISAEMEEYLDQVQYPLPMICEPNDWNTNRDGGYLHGSIHCVLGKGNFHEEIQALDRLNELQSIPWEINPYILQYEEKPNKPEKLKLPEQVTQFKKHSKNSGKCYAEMIARGNKFYFTWKFDKRGRAYSCGYDINLQSSQYKKAVINLANKEIIPLEAI